MLPITSYDHSLLKPTFNRIEEMLGEDDINLKGNDLGNIKEHEKLGNSTDDDIAHQS